MKNLFLLTTFMLLFLIKTEAQNNDLAKDIIGDWIFQYAEAKDLIVHNKIARDSILADIEYNKILLNNHILRFGSDSILIVILEDEINEGTYFIEGNIETYTFDDYTFQDTVSIVGDTLRIDYDQTEYYQQKGYVIDPNEEFDPIVSQVTTRYFYIRKKE